MLGAMINTTQVGYYAQTQKIINLESSLLFSLTSVLMPRMTVLLSENKVELANSYYRKVVSFGFMLNLPMTAGTILISKYLIPVFLAEDTENVFLYCVSSVLSLLHRGSDRLRERC